MKKNQETNNIPFLFSFFVLTPLQSKQSPHNPIPEHSLNTLSLYSLLNVTEQVLRPYNKNNVSVFCILIFTISENRGVGTTLRTEGYHAADIPRIYSDLNFFVNIILSFQRCFELFTICHILNNLLFIRQHVAILLLTPPLLLYFLLVVKNRF